MSCRVWPPLGQGPSGLHTSLPYVWLTAGHRVPGGWSGPGGPGRPDAARPAQWPWRMNPGPRAGCGHGEVALAVRRRSPPTGHCRADHIIRTAPLVQHQAVAGVQNRNVRLSQVETDHVA